MTLALAVEIAIWIAPKSYYGILVGLGVAFVVAALWYSGRDLAEAQNAASANAVLLSGIHSAVRAVSTAPPGLRGRTLALARRLWLFTLDLYKAEIVPPPAWSTDIHSDFADLANGYGAATKRRDSLLLSRERMALTQDYNLICSQLFDLRLPSGEDFVSQAEMKLIANMSLDKVESEKQARTLESIALRLPEGDQDVTLGSLKNWLLRILRWPTR